MGFYGILKIMLNVWIEAPSKLRTGSQFFERMFNVMDILLSARKTKLVVHHSFCNLAVALKS